jgi:hypothetical protein
MVFTSTPTPRLKEREFGKWKFIEPIVVEKIARLNIGVNIYNLR